MKRGFTLLEMMIVIGLIAIIAAIIVPGMLTARRSGQETAAIGAMRVYANGQVQYRKTDWDGNGTMEYACPFTNLYRVGGKPVNLIDGTFAVATDSSGRPYLGYYYADAVTIGGAPVAWATDFGLGARPATYNRTGRNSFIVDTGAKVFSSDQNGLLVTALPVDPAAGGWTLAE